MGLVVLFISYSIAAFSILAFLGSIVDGGS